MDYFEDVFWFVENIVSKDLGLSSGNIYNKFSSLQEIRVIKDKYFQGNLEDYYKIINSLKNDYTKI